MASFGFMVIRGLFAAAEHVAPRLTGRAAFELFCRTPDPQRLSAKERRAVEDAADFMAEGRVHRLPVGGGCIVAYDFAPEAGRRRAETVLVVHGWRSRTEHMRNVIEGLTGAGFRVIAIDLPGHGRSTGRRLNMALAVEAAHVAEEWFGPFAAVVGHSFGGAVATNAVAGSVDGFAPMMTRKLVLISAPSSMPAIFEDFGRFLKLGTRAQMAVAEQVRRVTGHPLEEFVGAEQLARRRVPALVIHAPDDKEVSPENATEFAAAGRHVELTWAPGLGHRRILADRTVVEAIAGFVTRGRYHAAA